MNKNLLQTLQSVSRYGLLNTVKLAVKSRISSDEYKVKFGDRYYHIRKRGSDKEVFWQIFIGRNYDIRSIVKVAPRVIFDLGANIGFSVAYFKNMFPEAMIVAVEPDTHNMIMLQKNTAGLANVHLEEAAIWYEEKDLEIFDPNRGGFAINTIGSGNKVGRVEGATVPGLIKKYGIDRINILKIDIEGAEIELFTKGDLSWLKQVDMLIIETHDRRWMGSTEALFKAVSPYSFSVRYKGESFIIIFNHEHK